MSTPRRPLPRGRGVPDLLRQAGLALPPRRVERRAQRQVVCGNLAASDEADGIGAMLAKAAGHAALTAARNCQQVLGGIGFTAEHGLHRHVRRTLVLDGLLGSAPELTREAGLLLRREGRAPRLADLVT